MKRGLVLIVGTGEKKLLQIDNLKFNSNTFKEEGTVKVPIDEHSSVEVKVEKFASSELWKTVDYSR